MSIRTRTLNAFVATLVLVLVVPGPASAATAPVNLGACASYGVFSQHVISNTGTTNVIGDLGVAPDGHPLPGGLVVSGQITTQSTAPLTAMQAAYSDAMSRSFDTALTGGLGGLTLPPGVYRAARAQSPNGVDPTGGVGANATTLLPGSLTIDGTLVLDAKGNPDAVFIFQADGDLLMAPNSRIVLVNGARFCRVFFAVRNARLDAGSHFEGHILAAGEIVAGSGATVRGQLLSLGGQTTAGDGMISLDNNRIDNSAYACPDTPGLPKTGYAPRETRTPWLPPVGAMAALAAAGHAVRVARRRARAAR